MVNNPYLQAPDGECASCDKPAKLYDVGALDSTKFCWTCITKYGKAELRESANLALSIREIPKRQPECIRCSAPLIIGSKGGMCEGCRKVYRDTFGKDVIFK